jgi:hypothetical protein
MSDKLDQIKDWFRRGLIDDEDIAWLIHKAEEAVHYEETLRKIAYINTHKSMLQAWAKQALQYWRMKNE